MRKILLCLLLTISPVANADIAPRVVSKSISVHCISGCPETSINGILIYRHLYMMSLNPATRFADWVAYRVSPINYGEDSGRKWRNDPEVSASLVLEKEDYRNIYTSELKADHGHLAPVRAFGGSKYRYELDYITNVVPQRYTLNRGAWRVLEEAVADAASYKEPLWVLTGPLYESRMPVMPYADELHQVPSGFFKIIYNRDGAVGFRMEQSIESGTPFCSQKTSLEYLDKVTDFRLPKFKDSPNIFKRLGCGN